MKRTLAAVAVGGIAWASMMVATVHTTTETPAPAVTSSTSSSPKPTAPTPSVVVGDIMKEISPIESVPSTKVKPPKGEAGMSVRAQAQPAPSPKKKAGKPTTTSPSSSKTTITLPSGIEVWCSNGYLHPNGTCSSTPEWPVFPKPPASNPCSGTASQCLDAIGGLHNDISDMLGSGSN